MTQSSCKCDKNQKVIKKSCRCEYSHVNTAYVNFEGAEHLLAVTANSEFFKSNLI